MITTSLIFVYPLKKAMKILYEQLQTKLLQKELKYSESNVFSSHIKNGPHEWVSS